MDIDLSTLSKVELEALAKQIDLRKLTAEKEAKRNAYSEMLAVAAKHGVSFEDAMALHSRRGRVPKAPASMPTQKTLRKLGVVAAASRYGCVRLWKQGSRWKISKSNKG